MAFHIDPRPGWSQKRGLRQWPGSRGNQGFRQTSCLDSKHRVLKWTLHFLRFWKDKVYTIIYIWEYHGNIMGISWEYHGNIMEISWEYHIMGISWEYHGNIMGIMVGSFMCCGYHWDNHWDIMACTLRCGPSWPCLITEWFLIPAQVVGEWLGNVLVSNWWSSKFLPNQLLVSDDLATDDPPSY